MPSRHLNMFNLRLCNAAIIRYSQLKFGHMHLCGMDYKYFSPHCCKCNSFGCTAAIRCDNACHGPHSDSLYSGNEHCQFNSPRLVKREAGFPNPRRGWLAQTNYDALMTQHTTENMQASTPVASFTKEVNPRLAKLPLKTNRRLANRGLTSLVKEATDGLNTAVAAFLISKA